MNDHFPTNDIFTHAFFSCFLLLLENVDEATCIFLCIGELVGVAVWVGSVGKKEARMALQTELNYRTNQGQMSIAEHFSFLFLTLLHFYCRVFILLCFFLRVNFDVKSFLLIFRFLFIWLHKFVLF